MLSPISPKDAAALAAPVLFVDIREPEEYRAMRIPFAVLRPLSVIDALPAEADPSVPMVFFCHSDRRTQNNASLLSARGTGSTYILEGGIAAWKQAGLPIQEESRSLPIMRQVQIAAGSLIIAGLVFARVAPVFYWVPLIVGAGLIFAGVTGFCGMARVLMRMPWNK